MPPPSCEEEQASSQGGLGVGLATSCVEKERMDMEWAYSAHSVPGWVLDKQDVPKGSSGFSILFRDQVCCENHWELPRTCHKDSSPGS